MRWLVKTAVVLGFSEGGSRRFMETPTAVAVPDVSAGYVPVVIASTAANTASDVARENVAFTKEGFSSPVLVRSV